MKIIVTNHARKQYIDRLWQLWIEDYFKEFILNWRIIKIWDIDYKVYFKERVFVYEMKKEHYKIITFYKNEKHLNIKRLSKFGIDMSDWINENIILKISEIHWVREWMSLGLFKRKQIKGIILRNYDTYVRNWRLLWDTYILERLTYL